MTEAMLTPWGEALDREHPLPEYPRPQLRRNSYLNLNGIWEYAITKTAEKPAAMQGEIVVPFSPETPLSGVGHILQPDEYLWYRRSVTLPEGFSGAAGCSCISGRWTSAAPCGSTARKRAVTPGATCPLPWM